MSTSVFGQLVTATDVRQAAQETLNLWLPYTLREAARQLNANRAARGLAPQVDPVKIELPASSLRLADPSAYQDSDLPAVFTTSPGISDIDLHENRTYTARWRLIATAVVREHSFEAVADYVGVYTAAMRMALAQHRTLGGLANGVDWVGEEYNALDSNDQRTLGGGFAEFLVTVHDVLSQRGPQTPPGDPFDPGELYTLQDPVLRLDVAGPDEPIEFPEEAP